MMHTILIVDDEAGIRNALTRALRGLPYRILTAGHGKEALAILAAQPVDVLLSDVDMPGMSGLELVRAARREFPDAVRILLTGRSSLDNALAAINEGEVFRYLTKPWDDDDLRTTLAHAVERLGELRRAAAADRAAERRRILLAELQREHPDILKVRRDETGAYLLDTSHAQALASMTDSPALRRLVG
jgi:YesN/AraC family two-component response regulator